MLLKVWGMLNKKFALAMGAAAVAVLAAGAAQAQGRDLVVASSATYAPFAFENKDKQIVGFDIDIVNAIAKQQGVKHDIAIKQLDIAFIHIRPIVHIVQIFRQVLCAG